MEDSGSWREFAWRRILRIVPGFVASLVLVGCLFGGAEVRLVLAQWANAGVVYLGSKNGAVWTLGIEQALYVLLAFLFVAGAYRRPWIIGALFIGCLAAFVLLYPQMSHRAGRVLTLPLAFFLGNLCYMNRARLGLVGPWALLGAVMLALTFFLSGPASNVFERGSFLAGSTVLGSVTLLWVAMNYRPNLPRFPDFSYACYLYHVPLIQALRGGGHSLAWLFLVLPLFCVASWFLVEKPTLALRTRLRSWAVQFP